MTAADEETPTPPEVQAPAPAPAQEPAAAPPAPEPREEAPPAIVVRGLVVAGPTGPLLDGLDLTAAADAVTALVTPAGPTRAALLRVLLGVDPRGAGQVTLLGRDPASDPLGVRQRVGACAARPAFYESMNALSLGRFLGDVHTGWSPRRFVELLARLGVPARDRVADLAPAPLARLALAAALGFGPRLLLVDVPDDLDAAGRHDLLTAVEDESAGRAVLVLTSRPREVERLADQVVIVAGGRARFAGPVASLLARVRRLETAAPAALPDGARALSWRPPTSRRAGQLVVLAADPAQAEGLGGTPVDLEGAYLAFLAEAAPAPTPAPSSR